MSDNNPVAQDEPLLPSQPAQPPAAPQEGYLFISIQRNFTSVFQISEDTPIDDMENNETCSGDLVVNLEPIVLDFYATPAKKREDFLDKVAKMVTDHQLRNKIQKLFVIHPEEIPYTERDDRGFSEPVSISISNIHETLKDKLNFRMDRFGKNRDRRIEHAESILERKLYADIALKWEDDPDEARYAVLRCSEKASYVLYHFGNCHLNRDVSQNEVTKKFTNFLNLAEFEASSFCCFVSFKPFTVLIVGTYENIEERKRLVDIAVRKKRRREAGGILWKKPKGPHMDNPAFAAAALYYQPITRDETKKKDLLSFVELETYTDPPAEPQPTNPV